MDARRSGNADLGIGERSRDNTLVLRGETVQGEDGKPRPVRRREVVELGEGNRLVVYPTARR